MIEKFKSRELSANEKVLTEGQKAMGCTCSCPARPRCPSASMASGRVLAHLKEGDVFGEMSLLQKPAGQRQYQDPTQSILLKLPKRTFSEIVSTHPQLVAHISELSQEREKTTKAIADGKLKFSDEGLVVV